MAKIDYDTIVKTADGTICRVGYVDRERKEAHVKPIDGDRYGNELTLPLAELKRVADPRKKLPPIEGLPEHRPVCQYCEKPLDPHVRHTFSTERGPLVPHVTRRVFERWQGYGFSSQTYPSGNDHYHIPLFHTKSCAIKFAQASWLAGMRMQR